MKIPNNCNESRTRSDTNRSTLSIPRKYSDAASIASNASNETFYSAFSEVPSQQAVSPSPSTGSRRMTWTCGRPVAIDKLVNKLEIPHTFVIHSYRRPTVCNVCRKLVSFFCEISTILFFTFPRPKYFSEGGVVVDAFINIS